MTESEFFSAHPGKPQSWEALKKLAKKLHKATGCKLSEAQEKTAKHFGWRHFHEAQRNLSATPADRG